MITKAALSALCATVLTATIANAEPFTYQGSLNDNGAPANGVYDIRFELYDSPVGGTMIGGIQGVENIEVADGIFTAEIDFGPGAFDANPRYLRIGVRPGDSGGLFTFLDPRTPINPAPKAQHATTADALTNPIWNQSGSVINAGDGLNRVFINRDDFITSAEYFGVHADTTGFVGMYVSGPSGSIPFYGYSVDGEVSAYSYFDAFENSLNFVGSSLFTALRITSDTNVEVTNEISADSYQYNSPKLNFYSVSGDAFHSASDDPFIASSGSWGAYISTPGLGWLVAPVSLPHGATITRMRVYLDDTAAGTMNVSIYKTGHGSGTSSAIASVDSTGSNGTGIQLTDNFISSPSVFNDQFHYHIRVYSTNWSGSSSMLIKSVVIEYTTTEAD